MPSDERLIAEYGCPLADYIEAQIGWHDHAACLRTVALWEMSEVDPDAAVMAELVAEIERLRALLNDGSDAGGSMDE